MKTALLLLLASLAPVAAAQPSSVVKVQPYVIAKTWKRAVGTNTFDLRPLCVAGKAQGLSDWRAISARVFSVTRGGVLAQEQRAGANSTVDGATFYFIKNALIPLHNKKPATTFHFQDFVHSTTNTIAFNYLGGPRTAIVVDYGRVIPAPDWIP